MTRYEPKFPHKQHEDCRVLTELTINHLPRDGSLGRPRRYRHGAEVWEPDDRADHLYFLQRGQVAITADDADGRELLLRVVAAGEPFGEMCFCGGPSEQRRTTARAGTESVAVEIMLDDFMGYVRENGDVLAALIFTFCVRLGAAERRLEMLAQRGAEGRLGRLLLQLATPRSTQPGEQPGEATLVMSHNELARMAAMSRQQVTLTLGDFRRLRLVRYERGSPLVVDVTALAAYLTDDRPGG